MFRLLFFIVPLKIKTKKAKRTCGALFLRLGWNQRPSDQASVLKNKLFGKLTSSVHRGGLTCF